MLRFVLADEEARTLAASGTSSTRRLWAGVVKVAADAPRAVWDELFEDDRQHGVRRPVVTEGTPNWAGGASMSFADAELAATSDGRIVPPSTAAGLAGDQMRVTGNLQVFDDHLVFSTHAGAPVAPFRIDTDDVVHVVGVVDGNPGRDAVVVRLRTGRRVVVRLGRFAGGLAKVIGSIGPA